MKILRKRTNLVFLSPLSLMRNYSELFMKSFLPISILQLLRNRYRTLKPFKKVYFRPHQCIWHTTINTKKSRQGLFTCLKTQKSLNLIPFRSVSAVINVRISKEDALKISQYCLTFD